MLIIRHLQLEAFREERVSQFLDQMVDYIADEYPRHFAQQGARSIRAFIERSMVRAAQLGVTGEGAVGALTELWLVYGESLEYAPDREWARNILAHKELPGHVKVQSLQDRFEEKTGGRSLVVFSSPR